MNALKAYRMYRVMKPGLEALEGKPLKTVLTNWKTSLAGVIVIFTTIGSYMGWLTMQQVAAITAVAVSFGLILAKDHNTQ